MKRTSVCKILLCFLLIIAFLSPPSQQIALAAGSGSSLIGSWTLDYVISDNEKVSADGLDTSVIIQLNADGSAVTTATDGRGNKNSYKGVWTVENLFLTIDNNNRSPDVYLITDDGFMTVKNDLTLHFAQSADSSASGTIYCPECGKRISAGSKFCMYCGHTINIAGNTTSASWGAWSSWSTTPVYETATRQVETRTTVKGYNMFHYRTQYRDAPYPRVFRDYSINGDYDWKYSRQSYGEKYLERYATATELSNAETFSPDSKHVYNGRHPGYQDGTTIAYAFPDDEFMWFIKSKDQVTEYRYRDLK